MVLWDQKGKLCALIALLVVASAFAKERDSRAELGPACTGLLDQIAVLDERIEQGDYFETSRPLMQPYVEDQDYGMILGPRFLKRLAAIRHNGRWLDVGVSPSAVRQFLDDTPEDWSQVVGITKSKIDIGRMSQTQAKYPQRFRFEKVGAEDLTKEKFGVFDVVSDSISAMAYTTDPHAVMAGISNVTTDGSEVFISIVFDRNFLDNRVNRYFRVKRGWFDISSLEWFKTLKGFDFLDSRIGDIGEDAERFHVQQIHLRRNKDAFSAPRLELIKLQVSEPPFRVFRWPQPAR